ncbi:hypothetical protein PTSG_09039 [Salpingoeca rosetta]|uniref:Uncharacterized protein n=1 Tax=Salpingoeca rosetta (strain ATCC 50818 / BSB-021) TaxID=946362 RepID=F2UM14_SALR5|nr:uncharacterized protein PTSG_09039 [Salpingoeca rosetta]EGD78163.1 hypothetical protein PTSG_09039 [Salpingoeca rosetta]|eukprot:XP_004989839.1 hypothetical protein PTSG_09039 [Salpingoeca rosetta]
MSCDSSSVWVLVAEQLLMSSMASTTLRRIPFVCNAVADWDGLEDPLEDASVWTKKHVHEVKRDTARAFVNLMLTCRQLYHDLPWAMPKWCLADVLSTHVWRMAIARRDLKIFIDAFQKGIAGARSPLCPHANTPLQILEQKAGPPQRSSRHDRPASSRGVWLENRFLVYSWLGATWDSECAFLRTRLRSPLALADFWRSFARFGRVSYASLGNLEAWCGTQPDRSGAADHDHTASHDGSDQQSQHVPQSKGDKEDTPAPMDSRTDPSDTQSRHTVGGSETHPINATPALFSLEANLNDQRDADRFHELRTRALGNARGDRVALHVKTSLSSLSACNINELTIRSLFAEVEQMRLSTVQRVHWFANKQRQAIHGNIHNVRRFDTHHSVPLDADSAIASVPCIQLDDNAAADLTPLHRVTKLILNKVCVTNGLSVVASAQDIELRDMPLSSSVHTLNATRVKLLRLSKAPNTLHLPQASRIELIHAGVRRITCPPILRRLVVRDDTGSSPPVPEFHHADTVLLDLRYTRLSREELANLARRVSRLELSGGVASMRDLAGIPSHAHVSLENVCVDAPVPLCVKHLRISIAERLDSQLVAAVPELFIDGHFTYPRIDNVHLLSGRQNLRISCASFNGDITHCTRVWLGFCHGRGTLASISSLTVEGATVGVSDLRVYDTPTCRLRSCAIEDSAGLQGIHTLVLAACTFDTLEGLSSVRCLVVHRCTTPDKVWLWPDTVFVNRPLEEMTRLLVAGKHRKPT